MDLPNDCLVCCTEWIETPIPIATVIVVKGGAGGTIKPITKAVVFIAAFCLFSNYI